MGELYVLSPNASREGAEEWVRPRPIEAAIAEAVAATTDLDADELADLNEYVDTGEVTALLDDAPGADRSVTFTVEGHEVTVDGAGRLSVA